MMKKNGLPAGAHGFTLIEIIVSLGIFGIASLIAVSSLLSMVAAQRKAINIQSAYDDLRYGIEVVSKELRTGDTFYCDPSGVGYTGTPAPNDCPTTSFGGRAITFVNSQGVMMIYRYRTKILNGVTIGFMERSIDGGTSWEQSTGDNANLQDLRFYVTGSKSFTNETVDGEPHFHSVITMIIRGSAGTGKSLSQFSLETTMTQRLVK